MGRSLVSRESSAKDKAFTDFKITVCLLLLLPGTTYQDNEEEHKCYRVGCLQLQPVVIHLKSMEVDNCKTLGEQRGIKKWDLIQNSLKPMQTFL